MPQPYPSVCGDTAEDLGVALYGYLKGKSSTMLYEQFGELKYKVPEPRILVQRVLCGYGKGKNEI